MILFAPVKYHYVLLKHDVIQQRTFTKCTFREAFLESIISMYLFVANQSSWTLVVYAWKTMPSGRCTQYNF